MTETAPDLRDRLASNAEFLTRRFLGGHYAIRRQLLRRLGLDFAEAATEMVALRRQLARWEQAFADAAHAREAMSANEQKSDPLTAWMTAETTPQRDVAFLRMYAAKVLDRTASAWEIPNTVATTLNDIANRAERLAEALAACQQERDLAPDVTAALADLAFARESHLAWAEHLEAHVASGVPCAECEGKPYKLDAVHEREWVTKYDRIIAIVQDRAVLTACRAQGEQPEGEFYSPERHGRRCVNHPTGDHELVCLTCLEESTAESRAQGEAMRAQHSGCNNCGGRDGAHDAACDYVALLEKHFTAWQPIETAPKGGKVICVVAKRVSTDLPATMFAYWNERLQWWYRFAAKEPTRIYPTLWMALPEPPAALSSTPKEPANG